MKCQTVDSCGLCQFAGRHPFSRMVFQIAGCPSYGSGLRIRCRRCSFRMASSAGAIAGFERLRKCREEPDVGSHRPSAGAGWPAYDSGRLDGVEELAIGLGIALQYLLPLPAGEDIGDFACGHRHASIFPQQACTLHSVLFVRSQMSSGIGTTGVGATVAAGRATLFPASSTSLLST